MPTGANWKDLENKLKSMMSIDKATTIPGSGNGKGEEDVVGFSTIIQCKFSEQKNITILQKDIRRLKEAAELQDKTPLFASENDGELIISLTDTQHLSSILELIVAMSQLGKLQTDLQICRDVSTWNSINNIYERSTKILTEKILRLLRDKKELLLNNLEAKYQELTQTSLFD